MKKVILIILGLAIVGVAVVLFVWRDAITEYFSGRGTEEVLWEYPPEHLIEGVPYFGVYTGSSLGTADGNTTLSLVSYWGDNRFDSQSILDTFSLSIDDQTFRDVDIFFTANFLTEEGYDTEVFPLEDSDQLKYLIANNTPVYVTQGLAADAPEELATHRLYIGYSDEREVFIVHDSIFGNNYEMSYGEYREVNRGDHVYMMIATPGAQLTEGLSLIEPGTGEAYPQRLGIMDDEGVRELQIDLLMVNFYKNRFYRDETPGAVESIRLLRNIISHEAFDRLHPAMRVGAAYSLAGFYMGSDRNEEAITTLEDVAIPLIEDSANWGTTFGEWNTGISQATYERWNALPWERLGHLYVRVENTENARAAFERALELSPGKEGAQTALDALGEE